MNIEAKPIENDACELKLGVGGMTCAACVRHVEKALKQAPGVIDAHVNLVGERADLKLAPGADLSEIAARVKQAGYEPRLTHIELGVGGMTCAACSAHVEKALHTVPGVISARVNLATERAYVDGVEGVVDQAALASRRAFRRLRAAPAENEGRRARSARAPRRRDRGHAPALFARRPVRRAGQFSGNGRPYVAGFRRLASWDFRPSKPDDPGRGADDLRAVWPRPALLHHRPAGAAARRAGHERPGRARGRRCLSLFAAGDFRPEHFARGRASFLFRIRRHHRHLHPARALAGGALARPRRRRDREARAAPAENRPCPAPGWSWKGRRSRPAGRAGSGRRHHRDAAGRVDPGRWRGERRRQPCR